MPGLIEIIILLIMGGGIGAPLSVPPAPEDPLLALVPAEECLYYTAWSGVAMPDPASGNRTEALLAEPQMRRATAGLQKAIATGLDRIGSRGTEVQSLLGELFPKLGKLALTRPACFYVTRFEMKEGAAEIEAGMLVRVDDQGEEIRQLLSKLESIIAEHPAREIEIEGSTYRTLEPGEGLPPITWGIRGQYLIACVGKNAVGKLFDSIRAGQPKWLKTLRDDLPVERLSTVSYADLRQLFDLLKLPGPEAAMIIESVGLSGLRDYRSVTGMSETGFVYRTSLGTEGDLQGVLALLDNEALVKDQLVRIPADTPVAAAMRFDAEKIYGNFVEMFATAQGMAAEDMEAMIEAASEQLGFKVREQLVASLGDHAYLYAAPDEGGLLTGWTAVVQIRDHMTLFQLHRSITKALEESFRSEVERGARRAARLRSMLVGSHTVYYVFIPDDDVPFTPSWCLTRDGVVFGLFPQAVRAHVSREATRDSLVNQPELTKRLDVAEGPGTIVYIDARHVLRWLYPFAQLGVQAMANQLRDEKVELDVTLLPSLDTLTRHLEPRMISIRRTAESIEIEGRQTLPAGSLAASVPLMASASVPVVLEAQMTARRLQAKGQMKQMLLALHNYHDVHGAFPAPFSVDKDGKPLLSWRVHILPYLEEKILYDRFRLDEPWDSEHNKKLIEAMPRVYRSPAGRAEAGHTNFLAVRGENAVFPPPDEKQKGRKSPTGRRLSDISDGSSQTIMLVEAKDAAAALWTKPADFSAGDTATRKHLAGLHGPGFHAGMADGNVRYVRQEVSPDVLDRLFDTRDGKPITEKENGIYYYYQPEFSKEEAVPEE